MLFLLLQTKEPLISNEWLHLSNMLSCLNVEILVSICFHYPKKEELRFHFFPLNFNREKKKTSGWGRFFIFPRKITSVCATLALLLQQKYSFRIFWWCPLRGHHHQLFSRCFSLSLSYSFTGHEIWFKAEERHSIRHSPSESAGSIWVLQLINMNLIKR